MKNKDIKVIRIPEGTAEIPEEAFLDYTNLEEVILPDSLKIIKTAAFKGCKSLKKINLPSKLQILEQFAFSECESLEEITIPKSLHFYAAGLFSHCHNLKIIHSHEKIDFIGNSAFYNCTNLEKFEISRNVLSIGRMAFMGCKKIEEIHIPESVELIEVGAFSKMDSLSKITVDENNKKYLSYNEDTVLLSKEGMILQYAINSKEEEFTSGYFEVPYEVKYNEHEENPIEPLTCEQMIYNIADYAFAGAKNLKKFCMSSETEGIGGHTFEDCSNLKELEVYYTTYGRAFLIQIYKSPNEELEIPFQEIKIGEGITTLCDNMSHLFKNARNIELPTSLECIGKNVFSASEYLTDLKIKEGIKMISPQTFLDDLTLDLNGIGKVKAKDFNMLSQKEIDENGSLQMKIVSWKDGSYFIKINDYDLIEITKEEIEKLSKISPILEQNPEEFIQYINKLVEIYEGNRNLLTNIYTSKGRIKTIFQKYAKDTEYAVQIADQKLSKIVEEIFKQSNLQDEFLLDGLLIGHASKAEIKKVLENYNPSISRFFRLSKINKLDKFQKIDIDELIEFCKLLEKYKRYDQFLYNTVFFEKLTPENQRLLIKYYHKNLKRLLKNSETLEDEYGNDMNDLMNLCKVLGVFDKNKRVSQRMSTFINEKMFDKTKENSVYGNKIHTIFSGIVPRKETDYEFITLFVENYDELMELEKKNSGIITRIYKDFREISRTSTSHRGSQRHLKVTIQKCLSFFLLEKFDGITEENRLLADTLKKYYSEPDTLEIAEKILNQAKDSPRNIFEKVVIDEEGNEVFLDNPRDDLREETEEEYQYEWLPKQDYDNLILGKYCSCCAHLLGAGAGIMRASIISKDCQNLVIRNNIHEIIGKMTLYVNREKGYAVFNTAEINLEYQSKEMSPIYEAFMRGTRDFVEKYNENNKIPIDLVTIGEYRNKLKDSLGNIKTAILPTIDYSSFGYYRKGEYLGGYNGDCKNKQILVLRR